MSNWADRENIKFMDLYEADKVLWNCKRAEYKKKDAQNSAIERILNPFTFLISSLAMG